MHLQYSRQYAESYAVWRIILKVFDGGFSWFLKIIDFIFFSLRVFLINFLISCLAWLSCFLLPNMQVNYIKQKSVQILKKKI